MRNYSDEKELNVSRATPAKEFHRLKNDDADASKSNNEKAVKECSKAGCGKKEKKKEKGERKRIPKKGISVI